MNRLALKHFNFENFSHRACRGALFTFSLFLVPFLHGQDSLKQITISEVQLYSGIDLYPVEQLTLNQFSIFAPNSEILQQDFSDFSQFNYNTNFTTSSASMLLGIHFRKNPNVLLRAGVNYSARTNFVGSASRDDFSDRSRPAMSFAPALSVR